MMMNLFSPFDPCTGMLSMNWLSTFIILMFNWKFWINKNNYLNVNNKMVTILQKEMNMIMPYKGSSLMFISLFLLILFNNMLGLLPYIFTSSAHLLFSLSMALPLWLAFMMYGWLNKTNLMFMHLVPTGTPALLMPLMVLIETTSNLIRPGSLAVRLTANMIAGHLLMTLLGNNLTTLMMALLMMIFMMLMMFELAVSMIQSYVFMTLTTLYSSEI